MFGNQSLMRRGRTDLKVRPYVAVLLLLAALLSAAQGEAAATVEPQTAAANAAVAYMRTLQNADGGFPGFGEESSPGTTLDAIFALVAADVPPDGVTVGGVSPLDYLETQAQEYASDPGAAAKLALAISYLGVEHLSDFGGADLLATMDAALDRETGAYGLDMFDHAFYVFTSISAGGNPAPEAVDFLVGAQLDDGGWEFGPGFGSDTNTSAMVVQALVAAGEQPPDGAIEYFAAAQHQSGGFGFLPGLEPDAQSTAFVIQALVAAGEDIGPGGPWERDATPLEALLSFQNAETGAFQYEGVDSPFATFQAVPGLLLAPFPGLETQVFVPPVTAPPIVDGVPVTPMPSATSVPAGLPDSGGGPSPDGRPWWVLGALIVAGAGAAGAAVVGRRLR